MRKIEYDKEEIKTGNDIKRLNERGEQGWDAIRAERVNVLGDNKRWYFKRTKQETMELNIRHYLEGDNIFQIDCPKNKRKFVTSNLDTIVIHYTAGRNAKNSTQYLARNDIKASAHIVIDRNGTIYQLVAFDIIAWHAGRSVWDGRKSLNNYSIGIELDNAGPLEKKGSNYITWFKKTIYPDDVVFAQQRNETKKQYWHIYTEKQIEVCRTVCELLISRYNIKTILGHEEISPGRKRDPGPAFPLDEFRNNLLKT